MSIKIAAIAFMGLASTAYGDNLASWKLLYRQTTTSGKVPTVAQWAAGVNKGDPTSDNYSILDELKGSGAQFLGDDGKFQFKLIHGDSHHNNVQTQVWRQTSNPMLGAVNGGATGYEEVYVSTKKSLWGGLEKSQYCVLDGSVNHGNYFYGVGCGPTHVLHGSDRKVKFAELYVLDTATCSSILKREPCVKTTACDWVRRGKHSVCENKSGDYTVQENKFIKWGKCSQELYLCKSRDYDTCVREGESQCQDGANCVAYAVYKLTVSKRSNRHVILYSDSDCNQQHQVYDAHWDMYSNRGPAFSRDADYSKFPVPIGTAPQLGITGSAFTASAWIYRTGDGTGDFSIFGTDETSKNNGLHLIVRNRNFYMGFYSNDCGSNTPSKLNTWQHVAYVYASGTMKIYVDGQEAKTCTGKQQFTGTGTVNIGQWGEGSKFVGRIRDTKIWKRALDGREIKGISASAKKGVCEAFNEGDKQLSCTLTGDDWEIVHNAPSESECLERCAVLAAYKPLCCSWTSELGCYVKVGSEVEVDNSYPVSKAAKCEPAELPKLTISARGVSGEEEMKIVVGNVEKSMTLTKESRDYTFIKPNDGKFSIVFLNDAGGRDIYVKISVPTTVTHHHFKNWKCGSEDENDACQIARDGGLKWNGEYKYTIVNGCDSLRREACLKAEVCDWIPKGKNPYCADKGLKVAAQCDYQSQSTAAVDLDAPFRIEVEVTTAADWSMSNPSTTPGGVFGWRHGSVYLKLIARFLHDRYVYLLAAGDTSGETIVTGSLGNSAYAEVEQVRGTAYQMVIEWDGQELVWEVDGTEIVRRSATAGFGSNYSRGVLCYGIGGGAQGWKGEINANVLPRPTQAQACQCDNGVLGAASSCTGNNQNCKSCSAGYTLSGKTCKANTCRCSNGALGDQKSCTENGSQNCKSCREPHYTLSGKTCKAKTCQCSNGSLGDQKSCTANGSQNCKSCSSGYTLSGKTCKQDCVVTLYQHDHYKGHYKTYGVGSYSLVWRNDDVSSIKVSSGCNARVFEHGSYGGWSKTLSAGHYNMAALRSRGIKNDHISSLKVYRGGRRRRAPLPKRAAKVQVVDSIEGAFLDSAELFEDDEIEGLSEDDVMA